MARLKISALPPVSELDRLCVVLVSTRNPLNIGAAARAMSNFGFPALRVVNPYDVAFREARSAVGAPDLLKNAEEYKSVGEAVADCSLVVGTSALQHRELQHPVDRLEQGAKLIRKRLASGRVALLFGSEKRGLANHDLSHCHRLLRIPTRAEHGSMNLGQAVAVCLYEIIRDQKMPGPARPTSARPKAARPTTVGAKLASAAELERFTSLLLESLGVSGYLKPNAGAATEEKIRRLVRRLNMAEADADVWLGMLRQVLWKLKSQK